MDQIADATVFFSDDFVSLMADGKKHALPKNLDDIFVDVNDVVPKHIKKDGDKANQIEKR